MHFFRSKTLKEWQLVCRQSIKVYGTPARFFRYFFKDSQLFDFLFGSTSDNTQASKIRSALNP